MTQTLEGPTRTRGKNSYPAIAWIKYVLQSRPAALATDFAVASGVSRKTITNLLGPNPRPSLYSETYERIMATAPEDIRINRRRPVPGRPAQEIVSRLTAEGWSVQEIAKTAGIRPTTLAPQNLDSVYAETVARLMRAQKVLDGRSLQGKKDPRALTPSYRVTRRAEALMAMGWTRKEIARRAQVSVAALRTTKDFVLDSTAQRLCTAYESMRLSSGSSPITMRQAKARGYAPWVAWPGGSIDVANALPDWDFVEDATWREAIRARYGA